MPPLPTHAFPVYEKHYPLSLRVSQVPDNAGNKVMVYSSCLG